MKRILGMDFGEKRIGLAISDPMGWTAQHLNTLLNTGREKVMEALRTLCRDEGVGEIVIGLPINMNGTTGPRAKEILEFVPELEKSLQLEVKTWDERLTSRQAGKFMIQAGLSRQKQKAHSDELAAIILLQSYLDSRRP